MTAPLWVYELAARFWKLAGEEPEVFPRDLRLPIARAFPLSPIPLGGLSVASVDRRLGSLGIGCRLGVRERQLRACLVAYGGAGAIFIDGNDPDAERRFSLAHELAHFLRDYEEPRRQAVEAFGPTVLDVFDGLRSPRHEERIHALLARTAIGFTVHLMERSPAGWLTDEVDTAERDADRLAIELLAPEDRIRRDLAGMPAVGRCTDAALLLESRYGLPHAIALRHAATLIPQERRPDSILERLRLVR